MRKGIIIGLGLTALGLSLPAQSLAAQESGPEALVITAVNVTASGSQRTAEAGAYLPGDVIEYSLRFTNVTETAIQEVVLNDPIPVGLVMVLGSTTTDRQDVVVDYSIDGGGGWSTTPMVEVLEAGRTVQRPAPADAYTHVRWTVTGAVPVGATVTARFRASVRGSGDPAGAK